MSMQQQSQQEPSALSKKSQDPFVKVVDKIQGFLKFFGMKITRASYAYRRARVFARRGVYPPQVEINIRETARGTAVSFKPAYKWVSIFPGLSFLILGIFALLLEIPPISQLMENLSDWALIDFSRLFFGNNASKLSIGITFVIYALTFISLSYIDRIIRVKKLRQRFPYYTRNAIWSPSDTPIIIDILNSISGPLFTSYIIAIIYFSPLSLYNEILDKLIRVYNVSQEQFMDASSVAAFLIGGYFVAAYSGARIIGYVSFRGKIDTYARMRGSREERLLQRFVIGGITGALGILAYTYLIGIMFTFPSWNFLLFLIPFVGFISGGIAALAKNEGEEWLIGVSVALFLASDMIFVFHTGNNGGFAWLIIITLMMLIFPLHYFVNAKFIDYTFYAHDNDPSIYYSFLPLQLYLSIFVYRNEKKAEKIIQKILQEKPEKEEVEYDETYLKKIIIDKKRLEQKAPDLIDLAIEYLKLQRIYSEKQKNPYLIPTPEELIDWLTTQKISIAKDQIYQAIMFADNALWNPDFKVSNEKISQVMTLLHEILVNIQ